MSSKPRNSGVTRTTTMPAQGRGATAGRKLTTPSTASSAKGSEKKHVGDVLGISRARVSKSVPSGGGKKRIKGIEITTRGRAGLKRARVVGGVRGRGV
jgi:hypothetical protein